MDPQQQRLQALYQVASANPGNKDLANAYMEAYLNYMAPPTAPSPLEEMLMLQVGNSQAGAESAAGMFQQSQGLLGINPQSQPMQEVDDASYQQFLAETRGPANQNPEGINWMSRVRGSSQGFHPEDLLAGSVGGAAAYMSTLMNSGSPREAAIDFYDEGMRQNPVGLRIAEQYGVDAPGSLRGLQDRMSRLSQQISRGMGSGLFNRG